ncbi:MAG: class I SAM-dependent methyltransferase [Ignavibacteriales bacterium]|nr:class I SAM-dependent methyltransferase [Ignavibacteriales bacterium]
MAFTVTQKIKTIAQLIKEPKILSALLSQRSFGYLNEVGWFESFMLLQSIDKNKIPIPWFSYPFIDFLTPRLTKNNVLFEFGSGNSTLFFSSRVKNVISIEHNKEWYNIVSKTKPQNVDLILTQSDSVHDYTNYFSVMDKKIDIIIVDGLHRNECLINSINKLSENGVVILDDSERIEYQQGKEFLLNSNFKGLEFWGIAPTVLFKKCTTLFYKSNNCLQV